MKILHNPKCSTSRYVLAELQKAGFDPEIVEYLKNPPNRAELMDIAEKTGLGVDGIMRKKAAEYSDLGLADADDDTRLAAMAAHPILIERPIVVADYFTILARPKQVIHDYIE